MTDLDERLTKAHAVGDTSALAALYEEAADTAPDEDAAAFFLTHAYVHALEAPLPCAARLKHRLVSLGREVPDP